MKTSRLHITLHTHPHRAVLALSGYFNPESHLDFREQWRRALMQPGIQKLVLDLQKLDYIDSLALGLFLVLLDEAKAQGVAVGLENCSGFVHRILSTACFDKLFDSVALA
jgi:HptB-dependent secretion and biofilm anti anti-sigma factor